VLECVFHGRPFFRGEVLGRTRATIEPSVAHFARGLAGELGLWVGRMRPAIILTAAGDAVGGVLGHYRHRSRLE
jgi:hypothetical protein